MKLFIIYLLWSVFKAQITKAQYGFGGSGGRFGFGGSGGFNGGINFGGGLSGSVAGSVGGEANLDAQLTLLGCPSHHGEINGNFNINAGGNTASGSVKADVSAIAWEKYCKCLKKQLKANAKLDQNGISVNASAPTIKCKNPNEEVTEESGYKYTIYPERGATWQAGTEGIFLKNNPEKRHDKKDATQEITYKTTIDVEHPLWIEGEISVNNVPIYTIPRDVPISSCAEYEVGTWDYVVIKIWNLGFTENGTCPQAPAKFHISQTLPSTEIMFLDKVPCGNYTMVMWATLERYVPNQISVVNLLMNVEWHFNIANDTSCTTELSKES